MEKADERYKIVIVGKTNTGKSSLVTRFTSKKFVNDHFPTTLPTCNSHVYQDKNGSYELAIWDTAGTESWISMNTSAYHGAQAVIFLASYDEQSSLQDIQANWLPLINQNIDSNEYLSFFAINKTDLPKENWTLTNDQIQDVADLLNVENVYYISAKNDDGITNLFETVRTETRARYGRTKNYEERKSPRCKC